MSKSPGLWEHFWVNLLDFVIAMIPVMITLAVVSLADNWWWRRRSGG